MREQWWKTPKGDVVRIREAAPDGNGRKRVEMKWSTGDMAYVWEKHTQLLLDSGSVPCEPQPGMLA
jgi:uncharacterized protein YndB with AHSA1/START domain